MKRVVFFVFLSAAAIFFKAAGQSVEPRTRQYRLTEDFSDISPVDIDTSFLLFHRHRISDKYSAFNAYPGNYGLPLVQINFFDRVRDPDYFLYQYYIPFLYLPSNALFMDTPVPFTEMVFTYAGLTRNTAEQTFRIRSSVNLNSHFNLGLIYDIIYSLGQYSYQKAEDKDFLLHGSYLRNKYRIFGAFGINNLFSNENGGVTDPQRVGEYDTRDVPVRLGGLNRAKSTLRNRNAMLVQHYAPTGFEKNTTGTFSHVFMIESNRRAYFDSSPGSGYYDTIYINTGRTADSLSSLRLSNSVRFDFGFRSRGGFELFAGGGIIHEFHSYAQIVPLVLPGQPYGADTLAWNHQNLAVTGKIENHIGKKNGWIAGGKLYLAGKRAGDFNLDGRIYRDFDFKKGDATLELNGSVSLVTPPVWFRRWGSNNFLWDTGDEGREFSLLAGAGFRYPARSFEMTAKYSVTDNFNYFNTEALPVSYSGALSVAMLSVDKTFHTGGFRFANTLLLQKTSNKSVIDLPLATLRTALWYDHNIHFRITGGYLHVETGAEAFIHSQYLAMSYMPATGRFHNQNDIVIGNYPFVNVFLNVKVKRTRILLSVDHVNYGLSGNNYYLIPLNPMNIRMFRYGLAWTFYD